MAAPLNEVHIFGDSHAVYMTDSPFIYERMYPDFADRTRSFIARGRHVDGASVAGLRPGKSKLEMKEKIIETLPRMRYGILAFGQVDLELGFYYRNIIKDEKRTPDEYVDWLAGLYRDFVSGLDSSEAQIAVKGVNLTALTPVIFSARYVSRVVTESLGYKAGKATQTALPHILDQDAQNAMHLGFNDRLKDICSDLGMKYFDVNEEIAGGVSDTPRMQDRLKPGKFDHHVIDSVEVRRWHYEAICRTFGFDI